MPSDTLWIVNVKHSECVPRSLDFPGGGLRSASCGNASLNIVTQEGVFTTKAKDNFKDWKKPNGLREKNVTQVESGSSHYVAMTTNNKLMSWGKNDCGQLGRGSMKGKQKDIFFPASLIPSIHNIRVHKVSCGNAHTLCLTEEGLVYAWGANKDNQLGLKDVKADFTNIPRIVEDLKIVPTVQVSAGGSHSCALSATGNVFCWGSNRHGQLGLVSTGTRGTLNSRHIKSPASCSERVQSVSCGENHTAFLTMDGCVYTCGLGSSGQLGHPGVADEFVPRKIEDLPTKHVTRLACGRDFTIAYVESTNTLHHFGAQRLPEITLPDHLINPAILCSKDCFFLYKPQVDENNLDNRLLTLDLVLDAIKERMKTDQEITDMLNRTLSRAHCVNGSFVLNHQTTTDSSIHGFDLEQADTFFREVRKASYYKISEQALGKLLKSLPQNQPPINDCLRLFLLLPCCLYTPENSIYCEDIVVSLSKLIMSLPDDSIVILGKWLKTISKHFFKRYVSFFKRCVSMFLNRLKREKVQVQSKRHEILSKVISCIKMMDMLNEINKCRSKPISHEKFYIEDLVDLINIPGDFQLRVNDMNGTQSEFRFCKHPFLYNSVAKLTLLRSQCEFLMKPQQALLYFLQVSPQLELRRSHLLADTRKRLPQKKEALRYKLNVIFIDEIDYCGDGIRQEFFQVLIEELLNEKFGACYYEEESETQWFKVKKEGEESNLDDIRFLGLICGLALYNGVTLHLQFPHALYKKLLNKPLTLKDLFDLKPINYRSCKALLDNPDVIEDMFLDFSVTDSNQQIIELCPNGAEIPVTENNLEEYISKLNDYYLNKSVEKEFKSFRDGFYTAMDENLLISFHPKELEEILVGNERYDFEALEEVTEYNGYTKDDKTIQLFWEVFHEMEVENQKNFLKYLSGTQRIPAFGIRRMKFTIMPLERFGIDPNTMLPCAYTCSNTLGLPRYTNKKSLKRMVLMATSSPLGFSQIAVE